LLKKLDAPLMNSHKTVTPESPTGVAESRTRARAWRLAAWLAIVGTALAIFWQIQQWQDYKNTGVVVAVLLAMFGVSVWTLRNTSGTSWRRRARALLVWAPLCIVLPPGPVKLLHNGNVGIVGWRWRWRPTPDELLGSAQSQDARIQWTTTDHDYPAFLGGGYWAEVKGLELDPDWENHPPKLLWKQPIGAGWSGFAIVGDYAITQEQRGQTEMVVCYELRTGRVAWSHGDEVRWDPGGSGGLGGVGPRATPIVADGRVYTQGATGIVNCIDASTGHVLWSRDTLAEEGASVVMWGKAGSPIVVNDWIVVSVGGSQENSLIAYDRRTGHKAWGAGSRQSSYATPVLTDLHGVQQIVVVNENFITAHNAADGKVLWEYAWPGDSGSNASASQPVPIGNDRLLLTKGYSVPAELIEVKRSAAEEWTAERVWQKPVLRTKLSNVLIRDGFAYAISDIDLECVDLETGTRKWHSRRRPEVGNGQIMLVGDHIVTLCESGEAVLVDVNPKKYSEAGSFHAIEGVTWNTPALSGSVLLVRNGEEAAAFELPLRSGEPIAQARR
jgi:outer membrane protein assembly factor BamB